MWVPVGLEFTAVPVTGSSSITKKIIDGEYRARHEGSHMLMTCLLESIQNTLSLE